MKSIIRLMRLEFYVMLRDSRVRIKLLLNFLLIIYVLSFSLFEKKANALPFFWFGFFLASPLIDYSFYYERINHRFSLLLGKGFTLRQIITAKSLLIFITGLVSGTVFLSAALFLNSAGILKAEMTENALFYLILIALYNYAVIIMSGLIQTRFEIVFPVRLINILGFILFVNFQNRVPGMLEKDSGTVQIFSLCFIIGLSYYLAGTLNKDKIF